MVAGVGLEPTNAPGFIKITNHPKALFFARNSELSSPPVANEYWDKRASAKHDAILFQDE